MTILNDGCLLGSNVKAKLSTTTRGVTITSKQSVYPDTAENATGVNTTPFRVSTSPAFVCGTTIDFTLTVKFKKGGSSVLNFSVPTCTTSPATVNGSLDDSDTVQEGRLGRTGLVSSCGTAKVFPGISGTGNRRYDVLTFPNGPGAACATIATTATNTTAGGAILSVAYLNTYIPPTPGNTGTILLRTISVIPAAAQPSTPPTPSRWMCRLTRPWSSWWRKRTRLRPPAPPTPSRSPVSSVTA